MAQTPGAGRRLFERSLLTGFLAAFVALASLQGWLGRMDAALYDISLALRERPPAGDIVIIGIDDASLARIGRWPWPRNLHAALLERLTAAGVAAVASDLILTEAEGADSRADRALARAIEANGRVILPVLHENDRTQGVVEVLPIEPLASAAAGFGHIRRLTDGDGIVRRAELWVRAPGLLRPHMALALLGLTDPDRYRQTASDMTPYLIPYAGPPGHYRHYSYSDVLLGGVDADELRGKVVFIGATATGLSDHFPTPVSGRHVDMPGVEICATLFDALRRDLRIRGASRSGAALAAAASVILLLAALRVSSPRRGLALSAAHALLWIGAPLLLLLAGGIWLPPAAALLGTVLAYPLWSWRRLTAAQEYMQGEIAQLRRGSGIAGIDPVPVAAASDPFEQCIDDVRSAVERLRAAGRFVQDVVDSLPVGILVADGQLKIRLANAYLETLFGPSHRDPIGMSVREILLDLRWAPGFDCASALASADQSSFFEAETLNGRHVLLAAKPFGADGRLITLADVTSLRQAQAARDLALRFLSHDMRAPLASILTLLQGPASDDLVSRIASHATAALQMAEDFTQLARAESLDERSFTEIDLAVVIEDAIDDAWVRAREKEIEIVRDIAADEAPVKGDRSTLRRAVFNLLDNAIRYSPAGTSIEVRLGGLEDAWIIAVGDQGYGIAASDLPRLFTPYVRLTAPGQPATSGTGLGLPMVKAAAERHGGRVEVGSELGVGSRFTLFLPRN